MKHVETRSCKMFIVENEFSFEEDRLGLSSLQRIELK